jgi:hypothetical protein
LLATLLTLFVVPSFYYTLEGIVERRALRRQASAADPAH